MEEENNNKIADMKPVKRVRIDISDDDDLSFFTGSSDKTTMPPKQEHGLWGVRKDVDVDDVVGME